MCWLWRGHFYVAPCHVAPLRFKGGGWAVVFLIVLVV